jgi:hypothetical protein
MNRLVRLVPLILFLAAPLVACGHHNGSGNSDAASVGDGGGGGGGDGGGGNVDSNAGVDGLPGAGACGPNQPQCNDCIDNDGDGLIDGADPECTGAIDNDESSFATGIPGDNIDAKNQDCYFDGNSGAGNDGCNMPTCCIIAPPGSGLTCPQAYGGNNYDPSTDCPAPTQMCIDNCQALTPPGCDCFGCCTICDPSDPTHCENIFTNPIVYPNCDPVNNPSACCTAENLSACTTCTPNPDCGSTCNSTDPCNPCPGQPPPPPSCTAASCPSGQATCNSTTPCPDPNTQYCSSGCCIAIIQ